MIMFGEQNNRLTMWTCKKCNEELEDEFDECWNCTELSAEDIIKEEQKIRKQEVKQEVKQGIKKFSNKIISLILAFISVFVVAFIIFSATGNMPNVIVISVMMLAAYGGFKTGFDNKNQKQ